ncbi:hypothetical protein ACIBSW_34550 [Actinoplanes sp. NPDC049668]|uniref:hypothetical protein n=1 Tax=unclassified Actinoplanes TaxID=2626549 RepID=UPI0033ACE564
MSVDFIMLDTDTNTVFLNELATVVDATAGEVTYGWQPTETDTPGIYAAEWRVNRPTGSQTYPTRGGYTIEIRPSLSSPDPTQPPRLATPEDVSRLTGVDVTTDEIDRAQAHIEIFTGRALADLTEFSAQDAHWLKLAVVYQAAWLVGQPDLDLRLSVSSNGQAGAFTEDAVIIAPLARKAYMRCSWVKSRVISAGAGTWSARGRYIDNPYSWVTYPYGRY